MSHLLKTGDVFLMPKGQLLHIRNMDVKAGEPTFHDESRQDTIFLPQGTKERPHIRKVKTEPYRITVQHPVPPVGEYMVVRTEFSGGGDFVDMNGRPDYWPDGHKVTARPLEKRGPLVSFYQTGSFRAMLENPQLIKQAVKRKEKK